eukprot:snap_masked-scaffold_26-processed-gene-1.11-mRNA-1 protein AED:1.00 eAED:1.00 QI:0/0/0/0/1/1/3/0/209
MNRKNQQYTFFWELDRVLRFQVDVSPAEAWAALIDTDQFTKLFCGGNGNGVRTKGECGAIGARYTFTETEVDTVGNSHNKQILYQLKDVDPERMTVVFTHKVLSESTLISDRVEKYSIMKIKGELRKSVVEIRTRASCRDFPIITQIATCLMWFFSFLGVMITASGQLTALMVVLNCVAAQNEYWDRNHFVNSALHYFAMYTPNTEDTV